VWIGTNHRPVIRGTDHAIWRRVRLIPFDVVIPDDEQDHGLLDKLHAEGPGILRWAVEGCLAWQHDGLGTSDEVRRATAQYRVEMDVLADFLTEHCILEQDARVTAAELYAVYRAWAEAAGERPVTQKALSQELAERGFRSSRSRSARFWMGLRLATGSERVTDGGPVTGCDADSGNSQLRAHERRVSPNTRHEASPPPDASPAGQGATP
jgi:putative DNA primase/helicase